MSTIPKLSQADYKKYTRYLFIFAIVIRQFFALKGIFCITDHDIGLLDMDGSTPILNDVGHLAYVNFLIEHKAFPAIDMNYTGFPPQFYHPPLFYLIAAFIKVFVTSCNASDVVAYEVIQQVNMIFSCVCLWICKLIMDEIKLSPQSKLIGMAICGFNPIFTIIGAELNNDCLMTMFCLAALLFTIRFLSDTSWKNVMCIMVTLVLAILSKTSGVLIAPAIGAAFIYVFVKKASERKSLFVKYLVFGITSIPLGLSWVVRSYVLYKVPFNYVPVILSKKWQYLGDYSVVSRLLFPSVKQLTTFAPDFYDAESYKNIWGQMLHTMAFDEGILYSPDPVLPLIMLWSILALNVLLVYLFVRFMFSRVNKENVGIKLVFGFTYVVLLVMFILFAYQYPFVCTVHYRYIVAAFVVLAIGSCKYLDSAPEKLVKAFSIVVAVSSVFSALVYILY